MSIKCAHCKTDMVFEAIGAYCPNCSKQEEVKAPKFVTIPVIMSVSRKVAEENKNLGIENNGLTEQIMYDINSLNCVITFDISEFGAILCIKDKEHGNFSCKICQGDKVTETLTELIHDFDKSGFLIWRKHKENCRKQGMQTC